MYMINKFISCCCVCWLATRGTLMIMGVVKNKMSLIEGKSVPYQLFKENTIQCTSEAINKLIIQLIEGIINKFTQAKVILTKANLP